tara:strand:+ start:1203 stop:2051 length:849 start_codon:yes stop_codon:yes gene_type:complete
MSIDFISGTYFKKRCRYSVGQYDDATSPRFTFDVDESLDNRLVFVRAEYINQLSWNINQGHISLPENFTLLTHNSDLNITENIRDNVLSWFPTMSYWYAQNLNCVHERVSPLPIGIANPKWSHGNVDRFRSLSQEDNKKDNLLYVNFNIATNKSERTYCLSHVKWSIKTDYPNYANLSDYNVFVENTQEEYLRDMSKSYFTVSPNGNGIDCHKTWEALYMRSIPIVTHSVMAERFKKMGIPLLVIEDWSCFKNLELSDKLYEELWGIFNPEKLNLDFFLSNP